MPKLALELKDYYTTVSRPINIGIARDIADRIGFDPHITPEMAGLYEFFLTRGSELGPKTPENIVPATQRVVVSVREEYVDRDLMTSPMLRTEWPAIFRDDSLEVYISPHYRKIEATISCQVRCRDHVEAQMVRSAMKGRIDQVVVGMSHSVKYNYNLPPSVMFILMDIYRRREAVAGYNETMAEWFKKCFTNNYRITTALNGDGATVTLADGQIRINGWFDGDPTIPELELSGNREGAMTVQFDYKFWYDRPETLIVNFPYSIHQQLPADILIDKERPAWVDNTAARRSWFEEVMHEFSNYYGIENSWMNNPGIPVPYYDDWTFPKTLEIPYHMNMFRFLVVLDHENDDKRTLFNMEEQLVDWEIWPEAIGYLKATAAKTSKPYRNVFTLQLWESDQLRDMKDMILDSNLDLTYGEDLEMRANYHVSMSFCLDPSLLKKDAIQDLADHWCFGYKYFEMIWPKLPTKFPKPDSTCRTTPDEIYKIIEEIAKDTELVAPPPVPKLPTVGNFFIKAMRRPRNANS